jgi:hypothetical protein
MSQPIHTPGSYKAGKARKSSNFGNYTAFVRAGINSGEGIDSKDCTLAKVFGGVVDNKEEAEENARFIAAALSAFDSAAKKLGSNAVEFAERMQDGGIAELVLALEQLMSHIDFEDLPSWETETHEAGRQGKLILAKVRVTK